MKRLAILVFLLFALACGQSVAQTAVSAPPPGAVEFTNVQSGTQGYGTWTNCNTTGCSGSAAGAVGTTAQTFGVASPSLSGNAMHLSETVTTAGYFNSLFYIHIGCTTLPGGCTRPTNTHFLVDFYVYIPTSDTTIQALEFDPDLFDGTNEYFVSMQCDSITGNWHPWNMATNSWVLTLFPCNLLSQKGVWHHIQWTGTFNQVLGYSTYDSMVVDGVSVYGPGYDQQYKAKAQTGSSSFNLEFQIDSQSATGTIDEYIDNFNAWFW